MNKTLLLASFIPHSKIDSFLKYLDVNFNIKLRDIFVFENKNNKSTLILTYKITLINGEKINLKKILYNPIIIHKKGMAIYSINGLNKLIEKESELNIGNIDYKQHKINWSNYQNKLILTNKGELMIYDIKRIFFN